MTMADFINGKDFHDAVMLHSKDEDYTPAIGWAELPENVIYKVDEIIPLTAKVGPAMIELLTNKDGVAYKAWACSRLHKELSAGLNKEDCIYIKPLGVRKSKKNPDRKYYHYELIHM